MPRYSFHVSFGRRTLPDEEGVELRNRTAARHEALSVLRELVNREDLGASRRWAGWFMEVAEETGGFFRTPIGHPALEVVTPETNSCRVGTAGRRAVPTDPRRRGHIEILDRAATERIASECYGVVRHFLAPQHDQLLGG